MYLSNSQILFCSPSFFNYEKFIIQELEDLGASVTFLSETNQQKDKLDYETKFLETINSKRFNFIFVIKGEKLTKKCLKTIKDYPFGQKILLQYDTVERYPWIRELLPYFDDIYSFDHKDSIQHGFKFRPHFIPKDLYRKKEININGERISTVCSFYYDRFILLKRLRKSLGSQANFYIYISRSKLLRNISRLLPFDVFSLKYKKLSRTEMLEHMIDSRAILDVEFGGQNGLTFRTLEALALNRKLITTNHNIRDYKFYDDSKIFILSKDLSNIKELNDFLKIEQNPTNRDFHEMYSVTKWCADIFIHNRNTLEDYLSAF